MKEPLRAAIIGTGFLGRVIVHKLNGFAAPLAHTFNKQRYYRDSIQLDLFHQDIASVIAASGIDLVIFTAKFEDHSDSAGVLSVIKRNLCYLENKRVIYISSDAVFDGRKGMYSERDLPSPHTLYGRNKLLCESIVRASIPNHCIVRTSYIYGHSLGLLDPRLAHAQLLLQAGQVFERFDDMYKSPIEVSQLADAIIALGRISYCGVIHVAGERLSVYDFYRRALQTLGEDCQAIRPVRIPQGATEDYLADTSLDVSLAQRLLHINLGTIESSLHDPSADHSLLQSNHPVRLHS